MKKVFHKIIAVAMAFVVFFSTMSFTMNMHYCGDTLVETAVFHKVKGCGMEMQKATTEDCSAIQKNCCNDEQIAIEGQDELQLQIDNISFKQQVFIASFVHTYANLFEVLEQKVVNYEKYSPPVVIKQIYKLDETYLI